MRRYLQSTVSESYDAVSVQLGELQLVPYRAPPMLELTCATVRDASYGRVAELTSCSTESFIRAGGKPRDDATWSSHSDSREIEENALSTRNS